jgi:branched-chain amino acid transport system permease protein
MNWVNALVAGVLVGGLYAMYATGLSISFGVMRLVNLSHGDLAIVSAFLSSTFVLSVSGWNVWTPFGEIGVDSPFMSLLVLVPIGFAIGMLAQKVIFDRLVGVDPAFQIVATFGLSVVIQNVLLQRYTANRRALDVGDLKTDSISIGELSIGVFPLLRFVAAVGVLLILTAFLSRTKLGRAFRATSDDPEAARLMGINNKTIYMVATGLAFATIFLAGVFNGAQTNFANADGPGLLIFAFEAVIIGGLGSLKGTLAGGVILGLAQTLGAQAASDWPAQLFGHVVFLVVLLIKPNGLFGEPVT